MSKEILTGILDEAKKRIAILGRCIFSKLTEGQNNSLIGCIRFALRMIDT